MSQTRSTNPFRPGSGILPPLLAGREHEPAIFQGRIERTRQGQPEHTALLGDWAIGKTTLLMHWRRLLRHAGDAVVLTMAYPLTPDQFLSSLVVAIEAELATDWSGRLDLEVGLDLGVADARLRRPARSRDQELRATMRRLVDQRGGDDRAFSFSSMTSTSYLDLAMFCCSCARAPSSCTRAMSPSPSW